MSHDQAHDIGILGAAPAQPREDLIRHRPRGTPHEEAVGEDGYRQGPAPVPRAESHADGSQARASTLLILLT